MRWAETEGKCFWKGNRWEEEKHCRLLISSLVLFLCCVCFMFPSSDWRDYRLCRFYVQIPLRQPNFIYFNRRQSPYFLSFFLPSPPGKADWFIFTALSQTCPTPQLWEKSEWYCPILSAVSFYYKTTFFSYSRNFLWSSAMKNWLVHIISNHNSPDCSRRNFSGVTLSLRCHRS